MWGNVMAKALTKEELLHARLNIIKHAAGEVVKNIIMFQYKQGSTTSKELRHILLDSAVTINEQTRFVINEELLED